MRQELENWVKNLGFDIPELRLDGTFVRFGYKKSSWFVGHEIPSINNPGEYYYIASVGDWRDSEVHHFKNRTALSKEEKKLLKRTLDEQRDILEKEFSRVYEEAKIKAKQEFDTFQIKEKTEYTQRKKIKIVDQCRVGYDETGEFLAVPLFDGEGNFWTFQKIYNDGTKRFFTGGKKKGNFFMFGVPNGHAYICEGYATGYSIHESSDACVIVAMDAGNLKAVASTIKEKYPDMALTFCADRDENRVGEKKAYEASLWVGGSVLLPPEPFKDFNDAAGNYELKKHEDIIVFPDLSSGKIRRPLATENNLLALLNHHKIKFRYNVISKKQEILIPNVTFSIDNQHNSAIAQIMSYAAKAGLPTGYVPECLDLLCDKNPFNPVATWITSKPWDGKDRLTEMYNTVTCVDEASNGLLKEILMKRWFISAVAAAFEPEGVSAHGTLVFQGTQSMGKTHWFKKLVPKELRFIKDGIILNPSDRDSVKRAISFWIVELGELDGTFKKSDIAQLKSFLTSWTDVMRLSYARKESEFSRRTVFFGSVNSDKFLFDSTGNRRFWSIECASIDYKHQIDVQQFWAQIYEIYKTGEPWVLDSHELDALNRSNEKFESIDPLEELILNCYDWESDQKYWVKKTATEIAIEIGKKDPKQGDVNRVSKIIKKLNGMTGPNKDNKKRLLCPQIIRK